MSNKIKISDDLNTKLDLYIKTHNLGRRSKSIVAEYAIETFFHNEYNENLKIFYVPDSLVEKIKSAQIEANKKISEALKKKREEKDFDEFENMTEFLERSLKKQNKGPYVQKFPFIGRR